MRLLLLPVPERPTDPNGDSSSGWHTTYFAPEVLTVEQIPRLGVIRYEPYSSRHCGSLAVSGILSRLVHRAIDSLVCDAVITNDAMAGYLLACYLADELRPGYMPPVFVLAASVPYFGSDELKFEDYITAGHAMAGACSYVVAPTAFARERMLDVVKAMCGPVFYKNAEERTKVVMIGPNCDELDKVILAGREKKFDKRTLFFGGRFTTTKGGESVVRQYIRYAETGADVDISVTAIGDSRRLTDLIKREGAQSMVKVHSGLSRPEAWALMSRCHVSMFYQSLKMLPATPYEQLYAGLVVLFKNHGHERALLPPGYPYIFETETEGATMLRWVCENYEEASRQCFACRDWVRENMDSGKGFDQVLDEVKSIRDADRDRVRKGQRWVEDTLGTIGKCLEAVGEPVAWPSLLTAIKRVKSGSFFTTRAHHRGYAPLLLYRAYIPDGWIDTCEEQYPVFRRVDAAAG